MSEVISQRELRNDSARVMRGLDEGRSFVLTRHGRPVGEVVPLRRDQLVDRRVVEAAFAGAPAIDADAFFADIDEVAHQDIEPRG